MRRSPSISPPLPEDQDVYLVFDDFGSIGRAWRETPETRTDRNSVVIDMVDGQFSDPVCVVAFNAAQGWSRDVSKEIALLILQDCSRDGFDVPPFLKGFIERHGVRPAQVRSVPLSRE